MLLWQVRPHNDHIDVAANENIFGGSPLDITRLDITDQACKSEEFWKKILLTRLFNVWK